MNRFEDLSHAPLANLLHDDVITVAQWPAVATIDRAGLVFGEPPITDQFPRQRFTVDRHLFCREGAHIVRHLLMRHQFGVQQLRKKLVDGNSHMIRELYRKRITRESRNHFAPCTCGPCAGHRFVCFPRCDTAGPCHAGCGTPDRNALRPPKAAGPEFIEDRTRMEVRDAMKPERRTGIVSVESSGTKAEGRSRGT